MENSESRPFWITWAKPDDPIYSRGWTVGSASPPRKSTRGPQGEASGSPEPATDDPSSTSGQSQDPQAGLDGEQAGPREPERP